MRGSPSDRGRADATRGSDHVPLRSFLGPARAYAHPGARLQHGKPPVHGSRQEQWKGAPPSSQH